MIIIVTEMGYSLRINVNELVYNMDHRRKKSLRVINLRSGDSLLNGILLNPHDVKPVDNIFLLSQRGKGKLIESSELKLQQYGGKGYNLQRENTDDDKIVSAFVVEPNREILMATARGLLTKKQLNIKPSHRHHKMKIFWQKLSADDYITFATCI